MFERNRVDAQPDQGTVSAQITLVDDRVLTGKFVIPVNKSFFDMLNGTGGFLEFIPFEGERQFVAKQTLRAIRLLAVPRADNLANRLRNLDGFDPHGVLGVRHGADWNDIRGAYLRLAKEYHPDRYSNAQLPAEVRNYLSTMARRINAAYGALESQHAAVKRRNDSQAAAVYNSQQRNKSQAGYPG